MGDVDNSEASSLLKTESPGYRIYKRRWIMLAIFFIFSMSNNFLWLQYSSISNVVAVYYSVPITTIDLFGSMYFIVYIIAIVPVMWLTEKHGLKVVLLIGATSQCVGSWLRFSGTFIRSTGIFINFIGQFLCGIGQACCFGMSSQMAGTWFGINEVSLANGIGFTGVEIGVGLGLILPSLFVQTGPNIKHQMEYFFLLTAIVISCVLILTLFVFESKPPLPPSRPKMNVIKAGKKQSYIQSIKVVMQNRNFILLLIAFGLTFAMTGVIETVLNSWIILTFSNSSEIVRQVGILKTLGGVLGPLIAGAWLDWSRQFRRTVVVISIFLACCILCFSLSLEYKNELFTILSLGVYLLCINMFVIVVLELGAEITYPESELISGGFLMGTSYLISILMLLTIDYALSEVSLFLKTSFGFVLQLLQVIFLILINENNRRQDADKENYLDDNVDINESRESNVD